MERATFHRLVAGVTLAIAGAMVGTAIPTGQEALGEVRPTPAPQSFQTGGQMSVPILQDISATLHQIDARMARLEAVFDKLSRVRSTRASGGTQDAQ